jgi:hypothetical protein
MQHRARGVAAALAIASLVAAAPASADPNPHQRAQSAAQARAEAGMQSRLYYVSHKPAIPAQGHDFRSIDARDAGDAPNGAVTHVTAPVVAAPESSSGFEWDDAAIGAGSALGLVLVLAGGAVAVGRRQRPATS